MLIYYVVFFLKRQYFVYNQEQRQNKTKDIDKVGFKTFFDWYFFSYHFYA